MSISIYYTARRATALNDNERSSIGAIAEKYAVEEQIEQFAQTGEGYNWESFCVYDSNDPTGPDVIFEGATKLPDNSEDAVWEGLQHWCAALVRHPEDPSWRSLESSCGRSRHLMGRLFQCI